MALTVVKSAGRALRLLEYFDQVQRGITIMEAARALGCPQSSTSGLLSTLTELGFTRYRSADRTYWPTARVALLGNWAQRDLMGDSGLLAAMNRMSSATGQTVILGTELKASVCYIHVIQATVPLRLHVPIGAERPLTRSGIGKVFLLDKPRDEIVRHILRDNLDFADTHGRIAATSFLKEIAVYRRRGYAASYDGFTSGAAVVAIAVPGRKDERLAVGIGGAATAIQEREKELVALMRAEMKLLCET